LRADLYAKIEEQIERTLHLIGLLPPTSVTPSTGALLGHLPDCLAGFCAVLHRAHPDRLEHFAALRDLPVNQVCTPEEASDRIGIFRRHIGEGFAVLTAADLSRKLPTVFVPEGESVMTLLLGNLEHLINHKHQLFTDLKLMGVPVSTPDLYRLR
jgi:hypothetical protein